MLTEKMYFEVGRYAGSGVIGLHEEGCGFVSHQEKLIIQIRSMFIYN